MDLLKELQEELNYLDDARFPRVTAIRNLRRVPSTQHSAGYSFVFEALVNDEWLSYGPDVNGNWTCRSDCSGRLPAGRNTLDPHLDTSTIPLGWWQLEELSRKRYLDRKVRK